MDGHESSRSLLWVQGMEVFGSLGASKTQAHLLSPRTWASHGEREREGGPMPQEKYIKIRNTQEKPLPSASSKATSSSLTKSQNAQLAAKNRKPVTQYLRKKPSLVPYKKSSIASSCQNQVKQEPLQRTKGNSRDRYNTHWIKAPTFVSFFLHLQQENQGKKWVVPYPHEEVQLRENLGTSRASGLWVQTKEVFTNRI